MKLNARRLMALLCASAMLFITACGSSSEESESTGLQYPGKVNQTIMDDSKWINSSIDGAIDESLKVNLKDDYYTAVNKDWILSKEITEETSAIDFARESYNVVKQRKIDILSGKVTPAEEFEGISSSDLKHDMELVQQFASTVADWETRNAQGSEPIRKYIEAIENISTLDEMTEYLTDISGSNFTGECFISTAVTTGIIDQYNHRLLIAPNGNYLLEDAGTYKNLNIFGMIKRDRASAIITKVLSELGYTADEIKELLVATYKFEGKLADRDDTLTASTACTENMKTGKSLDYLVSLCGSFPILEVLEARGIADAEQYHLYGEAYLRYLGRIYTEDNLSAMKAYFITHTALYTAGLLTREDYDLCVQAEEDSSTSSSTDNDGTGLSEKEMNDEWDIVLNKYVETYMAGAMDIVYVSQYCSPEQKAAIVSLTEDIIKAYHTMINEEEWMTETAKEATIEKLDYMTVRAVYPDTFEDYSELFFDKADTLPEMVQKINCDNIAYDAARVDQPVDKSRWDMDEFPTTTPNAFYNAADNSINILAGILESECFFNMDQSIEQRLGSIGCVIGHEITHAFDTMGCNYDKYGMQNTWWGTDDLTAFQLRARNLTTYYSSIKPYPYGSNLSGYKLSGEVIADMGAVSVTLRMAKDIDNFDYDSYFRAFAELWRSKTSFEYADYLASADVHPPSFLRANATLMQFDEFQQTYSIKEGDGMYLAPENRIAVW